MEDMIIDHMTENEVLACMEWAKAEGWNPELHDADVFHRTDPRGFFAARMNRRRCVESPRSRIPADSGWAGSGWCDQTSVTEGRGIAPFELG